jgi:hypothetical protein
MDCFVAYALRNDEEKLVESLKWKSETQPAR